MPEDTDSEEKKLKVVPTATMRDIIRWKKKPWPKTGAGATHTINC